MPTILKIGYQSFLVRDEKAIATILKGLVGAIALDRKYEKGEDVYWPAERSVEIGITTIKSWQILDYDPGKTDIQISPSRKKLDAPQKILRLE